jgi:hypothetical protein
MRNEPYASLAATKNQTMIIQPQNTSASQSRGEQDHKWDENPWQFIIAEGLNWESRIESEPIKPAIRAEA